MNRLIYFSYIVFSLSLFTSCEDVIELDLESSEPQLVIEAVLDATAQRARVNISQSNDFYDNSASVKVSNALVTLESEAGETYTLSEDEQGEYQIENVISNSEESFTIRVEIDGIIYEATSQVPYQISLDSLEVLENGGPPIGSGEGDIRLAANWEDPAGIENFYRIRSYVDGVFQSDIYTVFSDSFTGDGNQQSIPIRESFEENTTVTLELLSVDENYFDYFFQLSSIVGDGFNSTTPYNPKGNFTNEALGYFGIYFSSSLSIDL